MSIFDDFKRELEKHVAAAVASGVRISASDQWCRCPLGCMAPFGNSRPSPGVPIGDTTIQQRKAFLVGFDDHRGSWAEHYARIHPDFAELGRHYRELYP